MVTLDHGAVQVNQHAVRLGTVIIPACNIDLKQADKFTAYFEFIVEFPCDQHGEGSNWYGAYQAAFNSETGMWELEASRASSNSRYWVADPPHQTIHTERFIEALKFWTQEGYRLVPNPGTAYEVLPSKSCH